MPPRKMWMWFAIILLINFAVSRFIVPGPETPLLIPYTLFKEQVSKGNVAAVFSRGDAMTGKFKTAITYPAADDKQASTTADADKGMAMMLQRPVEPRTSTRFATALPSFVGPTLEAFLIDHKVEIVAEPIWFNTKP